MTRIIGTGGNTTSSGGSSPDAGGFGTEDFARPDHQHVFFDNWTDLTLNSSWTGTLKACRAGDLVMIYMYIFSDGILSDPAICDNVNEPKLVRHFLGRNGFRGQALLMDSTGTAAYPVRFYGTLNNEGTGNLANPHISCRDPYTVGSNIIRSTEAEGLIGHALFKLR